MNIQNTVNNRNGLLCAQSEDSGILIQHRTEPRINLREFSILPFQTEAVKEKATIEVRTKESIKNNRLMQFVQYKKHPNNHSLKYFIYSNLSSAKNNHSSLRGTVSYSAKLLVQCYSEHQGNFSPMMRLPDNIRLVGLANLAQKQSAKFFADDYNNFIKNSLPVCKSLGYSNYALAKSSDRFDTLVIKKATLGAKDSVFFYVVDNAYPYSMVALLGQSFDWLVSFLSSSVNPDNVTANKDFDTSRGDFLNNKKEIALMATIPSQTHPKETKFTDTYWIIPLDSNIPYGKVSLTRSEHRLFHVLFKDDRLVWSGRKLITPQSIIECSVSQRQEVAHA